MIKKLNVKAIIAIIPIISMIWFFIYRHILGPFYLSSIDPEYLYLINGLYCADLDFNSIGQTDNPGTGFQLLTALFIRITHLLCGHGSLVNDVISRPEVYLSFSAFFFFCIVVFVIYWLGKTVYEITGNILSAIIIQCSLLTNHYLIDIPARYMPDVLLIIFILIYIGLTLKKFYSDQLSDSKYALFSGILFGAAMGTKILIFPFLVMPIILIGSNKNRFIYMGTLIVSFFLVITPILNKLTRFTNFALGIINHDGIYGSGTKRLLNPDKFITSLKGIFIDNYLYFILVGIGLIIIIYLLFKPTTKKKYKTEFLILTAIILTTLISTLIIAKHYKNYYVMPMVSLGALTFYIIVKFYNGLSWLKYKNTLIILILASLITISIKGNLYNYKTLPSKIADKLIFAKDWENLTSADSYILLNDSWKAGPSVIFGLANAQHYTNQPENFYQVYNKYYPYVLSYNTGDTSLKYFMTISACNEAILKSGKNIFLLSSPGRYSDKLENYIESVADSLKIQLKKDTVYANSAKNEYVICYKNISGWHEIKSLECGFEKNINGSLYSDDEQEKLSGSFYISNNYKCNGKNSLVLSDSIKKTPSYFSIHTNEGDYFEVSAKWKVPQSGNKKLVSVRISDKNNTPLSINYKSFTSESIKNGWVLSRFTFQTDTLPTDSTISISIEKQGDEILYLDDLVIKQCRK